MRGLSRLTRRSGPERPERKRASRQASSLLNGDENTLVDHVRRCFQVLIDGRVSFPLVDEPVADAELEAQLSHIAIEGIEMLMMQHSRRHMHGIALIPIVALAAYLRVAVAFESV